MICIHCESFTHSNEECYYVLHGKNPSKTHLKRRRMKCKCYKLPVKICALCKTRNDAAMNCINLCDSCMILIQAPSIYTSNRVAEALLYVHRPMRSFL